MHPHQNMAFPPTSTSLGCLATTRNRKHPKHCTCPPVAKRVQVEASGAAGVSVTGPFYRYWRGKRDDLRRKIDKRCVFVCRMKEDGSIYCVSMMTPIRGPTSGRHASRHSSPRGELARQLHLPCVTRDATRREGNFASPSRCSLVSERRDQAGIETQCGFS